MAEWSEQKPISNRELPSGVRDAVARMTRSRTEVFSKTLDDGAQVAVVRACVPAPHMMDDETAAKSGASPEEVLANTPTAYAWFVFWRAEGLPWPDDSSPWVYSKAEQGSRRQQTWLFPGESLVRSLCKVLWDLDVTIPAEQGAN
jgi:hypothetical protein